MSDPLMDALMSLRASTLAARSQSEMTFAAFELFALGGEPIDGELLHNLTQMRDHLKEADNEVQTAVTLRMGYLRHKAGKR
ncbi:hypothetical protein LCGC14_2360280 [marine sediment metagenome]|uniref:Uncharacterized protein n=1 Tax=marine sediment metagenome TaxID=412755 RepID=A0A0F9C713_9ZZZZ